MKILVTGGAGYIGSSVVKLLAEQKHDVVVVDNLSSGSKRLVDKRAMFYEADLLDKEALYGIFKKNQNIGVVIHLAALKSVEESMKNPAMYNQNIIGTINVLDIMSVFKIPKIIFSSTAAVYGKPLYSPVDEGHPTAPQNYYGFTKLQCEELIRWYGKIYGMQYVILRYFNVAGDCGLNYVDKNARNVFSVLMQVLTEKRKIFEVLGNDYDTRDGTCIRDYIDINDLAEAHVKALEVKTSEIINLGTNKGTSVLELIEATEKVLCKKIPCKFAKKRVGDLAELFTNYDKAKEVLNWSPKQNLEQMIKSSYRAYLNGKSV